MNVRPYIFLFLLLISASASAQSSRTLRIILNEAEDNMNRFDYAESFKDSLSALKEIHTYIMQIHEAAYVEAAMDSVQYLKDTMIAYVHVGKRHNWSRLKSGNVPDEFLYKSGYKQKFFTNTAFNFKDVFRLESKVIKYSENSGYPFANIRLDSIEVREGYFNATLNYESGPLITFDTLALIGDARVKRKFIECYLGFTPGSLYNHQKVKTLEKQLRQIQYIKVVRAPEVYFSLGKAQPVLYINQRKCNQLDGFIGFQPNSGRTGKMLITGEFNMNLKNLFQTGKELKVQWKRFDQQSQLLNTSYLHPRLFRSNIDLGLQFNLLKQDTSFLNMERKAALGYSMTSTSKLQLFTALKTNRTLTKSASIDPNALSSDFNYVQYGIGYSYNNLDDIFYPMKGLKIEIDGVAGNKKRINTTALPETYNQLPVSALQWSVNGAIEKYIKIGRKSTLLNRTMGGIVQSQNIVLGDLYRVGGLKTLRGFNENNYYVSDFMVYSIEYRYFTEESSYLMLFYDQAYIHSSLNNNYTDFPLGFGTGLSFNTKAGVFQFVYALGYSKDQRLSFNLSKIHFGLVSRF